MKKSVAESLKNKAKKKKKKMAAIMASGGDIETKRHGKAAVYKISGRHGKSKQ